MKQEKDTRFFANLQDDYASWLAQILLSAFYDDPNSRKNIIPPPLLGDEGDASEGHINIPTRVRDSQAILHEQAQIIVASTAGQPPRNLIENLLATYEHFQSALQQLAHGAMLAGFGVDEITGLPTQDRMIPELERELERRSRRGQPFCFVVSRIDGDARHNTQNIILAARAIQKTIRSFDDAYVTGEGEFLSSLKHSDNSGGLKFVARLNNILADKKEVDFTMSSIVAEPLPGDNIAELVDGVRNNLSGMTSDRKGVAGQYEKISLLTRYVQSIKETS